MMITFAKQKHNITNDTEKEVDPGLPFNYSKL